MTIKPQLRPRRNRKSQVIRDLVQENQLNPKQFVQPIFISDASETSLVKTLVDVKRYTLKDLLHYVEYLISKNITTIALFPHINTSKKNATGSYALDAKGLIPQAIQLIKQHFPSICVIADVALDPYTDHGHDGIIDTNGNVLNDETLPILAEMAIVLSNAGADIIAPSDMMDGRVKHIRDRLDENHHDNVSIMSYCLKYASQLYTPFRDACGSSLRRGDKKGYQLNPANSNEGLRQLEIDINDGSDMVLVKPATLYLDMIHRCRQSTHLPIAAYHVSGEYAMVMSSSHYMNVDMLFMETFLSIKRAGASMIISYACDKVARCLEESL
jgi:porphobilinogen synthase